MRKTGERATRIRAKLLTCTPGARPEIMPRRKPRKMDIISRVMESSMAGLKTPDKQKLYDNTGLNGI